MNAPFGAPLTAPQVTARRSMQRRKTNNRMAATSALTFYDLLIEAIEAAVEVTKLLKPSMERVVSAIQRARRP